MKKQNFIRFLICMLLIFSVPLGLFAGGKKEPAQKTVGLVNINLQALFFNQVHDGAKTAAEETNVELIHVNANNDPAKQVDAIENFIAQKVDAAIILAIDVNGILPAIEDANKAGMPVIAIDAKVKVPPAACFIGVDNYGAGVQAGEFTIEYVRKNMGGKANIGIVGALNSFIQNQRRDGFLEAVQKEKGIKVVGTVDGQNVQEIAMTASENLVTANPNMNMIYATGEPALIGAIAAVEAGGYKDRIKIVGWDLHQQVIRGIDDGFVVGVVQQNPYEEGYQAVYTALKLIAGEKIPEETLIPITIVTKDNVDEYRSMFK